MQWPKIDPGEMIHRVTILQQRGRTGVSGSGVAWVPFVTTWASIDPVRGVDVLKAGQDVTQLYLTVKIRWQSGILPNMQVQAQNGTYIIQSIENPGERNVILVLTCLGLKLNQ
ncbi:MAG TPA: phage head closure protein [Pyrinomonadaceae bacterium]|jgi:SPP1 family predicted phage head-tail adaptor|nr:phage head closure protein [Pyrinomonadaceae bacterium]